VGVGQAPVVGYDNINTNKQDKAQQDEDANDFNRRMKEKIIQQVHMIFHVLDMICFHLILYVSL
jgi:hypothetical protein